MAVDDPILSVIDLQSLNEKFLQPSLDDMAARAGVTVDVLLVGIMAMNEPSRNSRIVGIKEEK